MEELNLPPLPDVSAPPALVSEDTEKITKIESELNQLASENNEIKEKLNSIESALSDLGVKVESIANNQLPDINQGNQQPASPEEKETLAQQIVEAPSVQTATNIVQPEPTTIDDGSQTVQNSQKAQPKIITDNKSSSFENHIKGLFKVLSARIETLNNEFRTKRSELTSVDNESDSEFAKRMERNARILDAMDFTPTIKEKKKGGLSWQEALIMALPLIILPLKKIWQGIGKIIVSVIKGFGYITDKIGWSWGWKEKVNSLETMFGLSTPEPTVREKNRGSSASQTGSSNSSGNLTSGTTEKVTPEPTAVKLATEKAKSEPEESKKQSSSVGTTSQENKTSDKQESPKLEKVETEPEQKLSNTISRGEEIQQDTNQKDSATLVKSEISNDALNGTGDDSGIPLDEQRKDSAKLASINQQSQPITESKSNENNNKSVVSNIKDMISNPGKSIISLFSSDNTEGKNDTVKKLSEVHDDKKIKTIQ